MEPIDINIIPFFRKFAELTNEINLKKVAIDKGEDYTQAFMERGEKIFERLSKYAQKGIDDMQAHIETLRKMKTGNTAKDAIINRKIQLGLMKIKGLKNEISSNEVALVKSRAGAKLKQAAYAIKMSSDIKNLRKLRATLAIKASKTTGMSVANFISKAFSFIKRVK